MKSICFHEVNQMASAVLYVREVNPISPHDFGVRNSVEQSMDLLLVLYSIFVKQYTRIPTELVRFDWPCL